MAYLGRGLDKISNIEVLDNITFDGSSSYSITKGSVAFTPNSAQSLLISIDGVVQATNFTVSSSTIDFGVAIPSTSVCNFFLHYGTGVMTVPSDGSVTTAKLGDSAVTTAKINDGSVTSAKLDSGVALGKVLQVLQNTHTFGFNTSSTSYVDTGMATPSITPASTSSKFLVTFNPTAHGNNSAYSNVEANFAIYKTVGGSTSSVQENMNRFRFRDTGGMYDGTQIINLLISPSTTSSIVFKLYMKKINGLPYLNPNGSDMMTSTVMEIA